MLHASTILDTLRVGTLVVRVALVYQFSVAFCRRVAKLEILRSFYSKIDKRSVNQKFLKENRKGYSFIAQIAERQKVMTLTVISGADAGSVHVTLDDLSLLGRDVLRRYLAVILVLLKERIDVVKDFCI